jgi:hypothetical protein
VAPKYEQLTGMSDADLIAECNDAAPNVVVGLEWAASNSGVERQPGRRRP